MPRRHPGHRPLALAALWTAAALVVPTSHGWGAGESLRAILADTGRSAFAALRGGRPAEGLLGAGLAALMAAGLAAPLAGAALRAGVPALGAPALRLALLALCGLALAGAAASWLGIALSGAHFGFGGGSSASLLGIGVICGGELLFAAWAFLAAPPPP